MARVSQRAAERARGFGIEVVDVRLKRADLPEQVQASVFARMQTDAPGSRLAIDPKVPNPRPGSAPTPTVSAPSSWPGLMKRARS